MPRKPKPKTQRPPPTPKQPKPWDPPPYPKLGDPKDETTFAAIGRALTAWEHFESDMAYLFAGFLGVGSDPLPASRAYGSVLTFRGRAEMVEAAAEAFFFALPDAALEAEIVEILKHATGFSSRRNEIAHGIVRQIQTPGSVIQGAEGGFMQLFDDWGFAVVPSDYATNKTELVPPQTLLHPVGRKPKYTYTSVEINNFATQFMDLGKRTSNLGRCVITHAFRSRRST